MNAKILETYIDINFNYYNKLCSVFNRLQRIQKQSVSYDSIHKVATLIDYKENVIKEDDYMRINQNSNNLIDAQKLFAEVKMNGFAYENTDIMITIGTKTIYPTTIIDAKTQDIKVLLARRPDGTYLLRITMVRRFKTNNFGVSVSDVANTMRKGT